MKELSPNVVGTFCKGIFLFIPVSIIPENGAPDGGKVHTDLVHTSCFKGTLYETILRVDPSLQYLIMGDSSLSTFIIYDDFILSLGMLESSEFSSDDSTSFWRNSEANSQIYLFYFVGLQSFEHDIKRWFRFGNHDNP